MSEVYVAGLAIVLALAFIAWQQVLIRRLNQTVGDIATGKVEVAVDGDTIYIRRK